MAKGGTRQGKVVTAGHYNRIGGVDKICRQLAQWEEIETIRIGRISGRGPHRFRKHPFQVDDYARIGDVVTGIRCIASDSRATQEVYLCGPDLPAIHQKLKEHGYK